MVRNFMKSDENEFEIIKQIIEIKDKTKPES